MAATTGIILIVVSLSAVGEASAEMCSACHSFHTSTMSSSTTVEGYALVGYQLQVLKVAKCIHCLDACITQDFCASYNFNWTPDGDSLHECELNYETRNATSSTLTPKFNFTYHDITAQEETCEGVSVERDYCEMNPCRNGGVCVRVCEGIRRVKCDCPEGRAGSLCEQ